MVQGSRRTTRTVVTEWTGQIPAVPAASNDFVCRFCLGGVTNYPQCFACNELFNRQGVPSVLRDRIVPMTAVLSPSSWYTVLSTYKAAQPEHSAVVASVAFHFLDSRRARIEGLLGGAIDCLTIVPSKRGIDFADQPLHRALARVPPLRSRVSKALDHVREESVGRREFNPSAFRAASGAVAGARIVLIEDLWVTGATAPQPTGHDESSDAANYRTFRYDIGIYRLINLLYG